MKTAMMIIILVCMIGGGAYATCSEKLVINCGSQTVNTCEKRYITAVGGDIKCSWSDSTGCSDGEGRC